MTKKQIAKVCFQILGRHFPGESGTDSLELRTALAVDASVSATPDKSIASPEAAIWKAAATDWLVNNISFKQAKKK